MTFKELFGGPHPPQIETPEQLVAELRAALAKFEGAAWNARTLAEIKSVVWPIIAPHRGTLLPPVIRVEASRRPDGLCIVNVVDVEEEARRHELWLRFFEAWLGVPRDRILYDGNPLP